MQTASWKYPNNIQNEKANRILLLFLVFAFLLASMGSSAIAKSSKSKAAKNSNTNKVQSNKDNLTKADLATADGSARLGMKSGNICCVLTSIETRVQLDPDKWGEVDESKNWTTWLTAFDDNLYANWIKNAPLNAQETVGIRINPDSSVNITNNTFLPGTDTKESSAQSSFEAAISTSLNETLKMAKPMPVTKNKLKEVHMSLTFMRDLKALPRIGKNAYGFLAVVGDKDFITVYDRTDDMARFPGIQILTDIDEPGKVVPLEQAEFNKKVAETETSP